jgi:hypothetical protein
MFNVEDRLRVSIHESGHCVAAHPERWLPLVDYPGYEVSDMGRVRSSYTIGPRPKLGDTPHILTPTRVLPTGYLFVALDGGRRRRTRGVHRLVLEAFVGPCPPGMQCCHGNGKADDNRLANLRWDTPKANHADKVRHGTTARGERNANAKLTWAKVDRIRQLYAAGWGDYVRLGRRFKVASDTIWNVVKGRCWKGRPAGIETGEGKA